MRSIMSRTENPLELRNISRLPEELSILERSLLEDKLAAALESEGMTIAELAQEKEEELYSLICFAIRNNHFAEIAALLKEADVDVSILYKYSLLTEDPQQDESAEQLGQSQTMRLMTLSGMRRVEKTII